MFLRYVHLKMLYVLCSDHKVKFIYKYTAASENFCKLYDLFPHNTANTLRHWNIFLLFSKAIQHTFFSGQNDLFYQCQKTLATYI